MNATRRAFEWLSKEHWLIGASLVRVSLGIWAVFFYVLHWSVRGQLWGPDGVLPYDRFLDADPIINVFAVSPSPLYFEAIYVAAIVIAVLLVLGRCTRVMVPLHWLMIWSFQERNSLLSDGGDNLMRIVLLFLILVNTGAYFSLDAIHGHGRSRFPDQLNQAWSQMRYLLQPALAVIHNFGVLLILAQLSLVYMSTGLYKVMGELWQNGTALYYILRVDEFSWPGVAEYLYRNLYFVVLGTYGTVLFEVTFSLLLLNRWTRYLVIASGAVFHVGIALVMGLVTFAWSMLSVYPLLLTDLEYRRMSSWLRRRLTLVVFYDGWCPFCTRAASRMEQADVFSLVQYVSFHEPGIAQEYGLDLGRLERRIGSLDSSGKSREGIDAITQVALRSPLLWPLIPLLITCRLFAGQRAYDAVAARRFSLLPGGCDGHCRMEDRRPASPAP